MKRIIILSLIAMIAMAMKAYNGEDFTYNGINYTVIDEKAKTCRVKSGKEYISGNQYYHEPGAISSDYKGSISLSSHPERSGVPYTLVEIGDYAFVDCTGLTSVEIPNSVKTIGHYAFWICRGLTSVEIPNSVTYIGAGAFRGCKGLTSVEISNSVETIDFWAFSLCTGLTSVEIPNSVTYIGNYAFSGCSGLTSVEIPNSVTYIGNYAFSGCSGLTSVEIPNSVTDIGDYAFSYCSALTSVGISNSNSSKTIGNYAFAGCTGLTHVEFADIESICSIHFGNSYSNPLFYTHNLYINGEEIKDLIIPNSVTSIGAYAFVDCTGLTSVKIPNSVTGIESNVFSGCTGLTRVEFADIESICSIHFGNSYSNPLFYTHNLYINGKEIKDLTIPNSVTSIGGSAFSGCSGLTSVTIPNSVTWIGWSAFSGCSGLTSVEIPNSVTSIGDYAFGGCSKLTWAVIGNSVTEFPSKIFSNTNLSLLFIGNSLNTISKDAFENTDLKRVFLSNKYASNDKSWFECFGTDVIFHFYNPSEGLDFVHQDDCLFSGNCEILYCGLTLSGDYVVPETVKTIDDGAFKGCDELKSVVIPHTVTTVGKDIFGGLSGVKKYAKPSTLQLYTGGDAVAINYEVYDSRIEEGFVYSRNKRTVYFAPTQLPDDYVLPATVKTIGDYAFAYCDFESVDLDDTLTNIGNNAFSDCINLKSVRLGVSVSQIGSGAWNDCNAIESIECRMPAPIAAPNNIFPIDVYDNATLYVPKGSVDDYMEVAPWSYFYNIEEYTPVSGMDDIMPDGDDCTIDYSKPYDVYSLSGVKLNTNVDQLAPGLYVVRQGSRAIKVQIN